MVTLIVIVASILSFSKSAYFMSACTRHQQVDIDNVHYFLFNAVTEFGSSFTGSLSLSLLST